MKTNKEIIFWTMNIAFLAFSSLFLFIFGGFWIGSKEDYIELMQVSRLPFIFKKSLMSIVVSLAMISVGYLLVRWVFKLTGKFVNKAVLIDSIILVIISVGTVLYHHWNSSLN